MKTIIAPTDFSKISENACLYAAKLAADINADLLLLHVMELPVAVAEYPVSETVFDEEEVEKELQSLKNKLLTTTHNKVRIRTRNLLGSPEYQINEVCKTEHPFAVVIATHTFSVVDRFFLGSTAAYSARHLHYPVIVVPHNARYEKIKKIAIASDLRDIYEIPVDEIEKMVRLFNADLEVFYAGKNEKDINSTSVDGMLLHHRLIALNPDFYVVEAEDVMMGIMSLVKEHNIDMLIILPKKHGLFHKSQTKEFVLYADKPLMAIHEDDAN